ncbi:type II 3-dehydroquinate dehydratase [Tepidibacter thalassicus]|uniref:3-dehydroquinate dehydratase n=1 Tax=Tepidibacter thalassicus DSM 15285 TaxID=1123350 RepID=A0A1M5Q1X8_9FIRM|nr:type II 3-dehydroquinate dehydratase [Tepidibacter thalassicus]SHH07761.1 3-dehydroquinate dehydratase [Tepidibacter thalassicus DSM 15285]
MKKILVVNGPNLNLLGFREKDVYGKSSIEDLEITILNECKKHDVIVDFFQSNCEGKIIDKLHESIGVYEGIIINPGAYTHYSFAIYDAIKAINIPTVEVHISNIYSREEFRQNSVIAKACIGQISGFGFYSYVLAVYSLVDYFKKGENK